MNYEQISKEVIKHVGGKENIVHLEHCSTRLRFSLANNDKANVEKLEQIDGILSVRMGAQCQVVIGNEVIEVYQAIANILGDELSNNQNQTNKGTEKRNIGSIFLDYLIGIFQPLIPAIAGGGFLKSILMLLDLLGIIDPEGQTYTVFMMIGDAPLYFLPILVAITTANKFKSNALVAASIVGALLLPDMLALMEEGADLFSLGLQNIDYAYQVFPAILTIILYSQIEKLWTKVSPKAIRIFFVPMMSMAVTVPIALLILGPLGYILGQGLTSVILFIYGYAGWIAVAILAAILPLMVAGGMHKALIPYSINSLGETGKELLYLPASLAHNISESGACFAVALRTKDKNLKATAISAGISALFGITEPALYGVTLQNKKVLYSVIFGSFIGGAFIGIVGLEAYALVGPGVASLSMYISEDLPMNIAFALIGLVLSFALAFVAVLVLFRDNKGEGPAREDDTSSFATTQVESVSSPAEGTIVPLSEVNDDVFSTKIMGEGIGINPTEGILFAPADGKIKMVFDTKHALGMELENGAELLFHVGIDTVQLNGKYFESHAKEGDIVKKGDQLLSFDVNQITSEGFESVILCVVTSKDTHKVDVLEDKQQVDLQDIIMNISKIGE